MAGLYLRGKTWWITYRLEGKNVFESTKTRDRRKAERVKAAKELALESGDVRAEIKLSFEAFKKTYEESYLAAGGRDLAKSRAVSWKKDAHSLRRFEAFADSRKVRRVDRVTVALAEDFKRVRSEDGVADSTVNKDLRFLKAAWNWGRRRGLVRENPFELVRPIPIAQKEIEFLAPAEVVKLLDAYKGSRYFPLVATGIYAGLRIGELVSLQWTDVNLREGSIRVANKETFKTKSRRIRRVPIAAELRAILEPIHGKTGGKTGLCFPSNADTPLDGTKVGHSLLKVGKGLKLHVTPHVLRKTFGTLLRARGVPLEKISAWLGHSSIAVTEKWYAGHTFDPTDREIEVLTFEPKPPAAGPRKTAEGS